MKTDDQGFVVIENLTEAVGKMVHVWGWNKGCVFIYEGSQGLQHKLVTPKTKKVYFCGAATPLLWTRKVGDRIKERESNGVY